jgi:hypothetical protein
MDERTCAACDCLIDDVTAHTAERVLTLDEVSVAARSEG